MRIRSFEVQEAEGVSAEGAERLLIPVHVCSLVSWLRERQEAEIKHVS